MAKTARGTLDELKGSISKDFNAYAQEVYAEIVKTTPVRSGQARRSWTKPQPTRKDNYNAVITSSSLPYMQPLDEGYSKQAPNGIIQPAIDKVTRRYNK